MYIKALKITIHTTHTDMLVILASTITMHKKNASDQLYTHIHTIICL